MDDAMEIAEDLLDERSMERLVQALECRLTVGQALGIAMERHQLDEDQAMQYLVFEASNQGLTLRDAAQRLVEGCNTESERLDPHGLSIRRVTRFPRNGSRRTL